MLETWQQSHNDNNNEIKIAKLCVNKTRALDNARTHTRTHRKCNGCISSKMVANCVDIGIINIYGLWNDWAIERVCADADATLVCECRNSGNNNNNNNTAIDSLTNYAKNDIWYFGPLKMANIYRCTQWAPFKRFVSSFFFRSFFLQTTTAASIQDESIHSFLHFWEITDTTPEKKLQRWIDGRGRNLCDIEFSSEHHEFGGEMHHKIVFFCDIETSTACDCLVWWFQCTVERWPKSSFWFHFFSFLFLVDSYIFDLNQFRLTPYDWIIVLLQLQTWCFWVNFQICRT